MFCFVRLTKEHKEKNTEKTQNKNKIYAEEKAEIGNVGFINIYGFFCNQYTKK